MILRIRKLATWNCIQTISKTNLMLPCLLIKISPKTMSYGLKRLIFSQLMGLSKLSLAAMTTHTGSKFSSTQTTVAIYSQLSVMTELNIRKEECLMKKLSSCKNSCAQLKWLSKPLNQRLEKFQLKNRSKFLIVSPNKCFVKIIE